MAFTLDDALFYRDLHPKTFALWRAAARRCMESIASAHCTVAYCTSAASLLGLVMACVIPIRLMVLLYASSTILRHSFALSAAMPEFKR